MRKHWLPSGCLFGFLLGLTGIAFPVSAQTTASNEWTWKGGSDTFICCNNSLGGLSIPSTPWAPVLRNIPEGRLGSLPGQAVSSPMIVSSDRALPLSFERNQGQADARVVFLSRGAGYTFFAADREAVLELLKTTPMRTIPDRLDRTHSGGRQREVIKTDEIRMQFVGASDKMRLTGEDLLPGTVNYFLGNDSAKWHTRIPTFGQVQYSGVYPGINLLYYGNRSRLEFDFQLTPGASAS